MILPETAPFGFIKLDVEGGELAALRGAASLLHRCRPTILFEWTRTGATAFGLDPAAIHDELTGGAGYQIYLIKSWLAGGSAVTRSEFIDAMTYPFAAFNFLARPTEQSGP